MIKDINCLLTEDLFVQTDADSIRFIRFFDDLFEEEGFINNPEGLVVLPNGNLLVIKHKSSNQNISNEITTDEELVSVGNLPASITPINTAFDRQFKRLLSLDSNANKLIEINLGANGTLDPDTSIEIEAKSFGIQDAKGVTVSPNGTLYVLDNAVQQVVVIKPDTEGNFERATISHINLPMKISKNLQGIAFDPKNGNFFILSPAQRQLYELNQIGHLLNTWDLSKLGLKNPQAIVFADSGDSTDNTQQQSLYVADKNLGLVELSVTNNKITSQAAKFSESLEMVQTIDSSPFNQLSPELSDITYLSSGARLVILDGEVHETLGTAFEGVNLWELNLCNWEERKGDTKSFSDTIDANNVEVNDLFSAGLVFNSASPSQGIDSDAIWALSNLTNKGTPVTLEMITTTTKPDSYTTYASDALPLSNLTPIQFLVILFLVKMIKI